jgi:MFS family permease
MAGIGVGVLSRRAKHIRDAPASQLLAVRNFRYLVGGVALGFGAFTFNRMAQSWLVLEMTDSKLWVGLVAGASTITAMAFSLVAGALADRLDLKHAVVHAGLRDWKILHFVLTCPN